MAEPRTDDIITRRITTSVAPEDGTINDMVRPDDVIVTNAYAPDDEIASARAEIEETRANMGETLAAIQEKLDPQALFAQARETAMDVVSNVAEQAKTTVHTIVTDVSENAKDAATGAVSGAVNEVKDAVGDAVTATKEAVGTAYETTRKAGANMMELVAKNPVQTALLLGAGWYLYNRINDTTRRRQDVGYAASAATVRKPYSFYEVNHDPYHSKGFVGNILDAARRNPIPTALLVGAAYQLYNNPATIGATEPSYRVSDAAATHGVTDTVNQTLKAAGEKAGDAVASAKDAVGEAYASAKETVGEAVTTAKDTVGGALDTVKDALGNATATVKETATQATQSAGELVSNVRDTAYNAGTDLIESVRVNPLPAAAWALGLGALLAFLLPNTESENRLMGGARDSLLNTAQNNASQLLDKVQNVSSKTWDAVSETVQQEAKNEGLTTPQMNPTTTPQPA